MGRHGDGKDEAMDVTATTSTSSRSQDESTRPEDAIPNNTSDSSRSSRARRRCTYFMLSGLAILGFGVGQFWNWQKPMPSRPSIVVSGDTAHVAFKPIVLLTHDHSPQQVQVQLQNPWSSSIDIESIRTSCSCSEAKVRDRRIRAGASTELDLRITIPFSGLRRNVELTILTKQKRVILGSLELRAMRHIHVAADPPETLAFEAVSVSTEVQRSWPAYVLEKKEAAGDIEVVCVSSDRDDVHFEFVPNVVDERRLPTVGDSPGVVARPYLLKGHLRAGQRPGHRSSSVRIVYSSDGKEYERHLMATWRVLPALRIEPQQVVWHVSDSQGSEDPGAARVVITAEDGRLFRIKSFESELPWLAVECDAGDAHRAHEIVLRLRDWKAALHDGFQEVTFRTDHPRQPTVRLSVTVVGMPSDGGS